MAQDQVQWVVERINGVSFWNLPTLQPSDGTVGLDGAQWIIEGAKDGRYHVIDRWSPDRDNPAHIIGMIFAIDLAKLRLLYQEVY